MEVSRVRTLLCDFSAFKASRFAPRYAHVFKSRLDAYLSHTELGCVGAIFLSDIMLAVLRALLIAYPLYPHARIAKVLLSPKREPIVCQILDCVDQ